MKMETTIAAVVCWSLAAWSPALAAPGAEARPPSAGNLDLRLDQALAGFELDRQSPEDAPAPIRFGLTVDRPAPDGVAANQTDRFEPLPRQKPSEISWHSLQETSEPIPASPVAPEKERGRWLKKHWYVPVLAAGVVYLLIEESGDNIRDSIN